MDLNDDNGYIRNERYKTFAKKKNKMISFYNTYHSEPRFGLEVC